MAEAVILATITKIGSALGTEAIGQVSAQFKKSVTQLTELQGSMGRIMSELRMMHEFLCQIDIRNRNNSMYETWLGEVRKAVHVIEDIIDEYLHLVGQEHDDLMCCFYMKKGFQQPKALLSLNRIASLVKETEVNLEHLSKAKDRWVPMTNSGNMSYIVERSQHLASFSRSICEDDLVGIEKNREILTQWLGGNELARSVIVLHGMGGLGKTTLAANVYRKERENFQCNAWVSISQAYSREDVRRKLINEVYKDKQNITSNIDSMDITGLEDTLKSYLEPNKYLIIMDDVWTPEAFTDLLGALVPNLKGSRIIITTRMSNVAQLASQGKTLTLEALPEDKSWELFCKKAFPIETSHTCPAELETMSKQIVSKCKGLPLAIVSIGSLMFVREKTKEEWKRIHDQLSWELAHNQTLDDVRNILLLSFIYLPSYLKSCFLYCSLFPEDFKLRRRKLIKLWIAEGFIEERGESTVEEVAEYYLKELVHRNMLQLVKCNSFGRIKACKMHDIVRELAIDLYQRESFGVVYESSKARSSDMNTRRLVIQKCSNDIQSISNLHHVRSIIGLDNNMPSSTLLSYVSGKFKYLLVLELEGLPIENVPYVIGDLFNLRHLGMRDSKVKSLPKSISKLSNLLTLDLGGSQIKELPPEISKLKKLRHLYVEKLRHLYVEKHSKQAAPTWRPFEWGSGVYATKGLWNLTELQTLQGMEAQDKSVRYLKQLRQLRTLRIWNVKRIYCEDLCKSLLEMKFLSNLCIIASNENEILQLNSLNAPPLNLQKLFLEGQLAQGTLESPLFQIAGKNLYELLLYWTQLREDPLPSLSRLLNLTTLHLIRAYNGEQLITCTGWFPKLKVLRLGDLPNLNQLVIQEGAMMSLESLELYHLNKLMEVPLGIEFLKSLQVLFFGEITNEFFSLLRDCSRIQHIRLRYFSEDAQDDQRNTV